MQTREIFARISTYRPLARRPMLVMPRSGHPPRLPPPARHRHSDAPGSSDVQRSPAPATGGDTDACRQVPPLRWPAALRFLTAPRGDRHHQRPAAATALLEAAAARAAGTLVVDMTGTQFCDSSGPIPCSRRTSAPRLKAASWPVRSSPLPASSAFSRSPALTTHDPQLHEPGPGPHANVRQRVKRPPASKDGAPVKAVSRTGSSRGTPSASLTEKRADRGACGATSACLSGPGWLSAGA